MAEQTLPPEIVAYLQSQADGRVETANDAMKQLTDRERHVLREAAVMGWVRGAMAAGGGRESIPKDIAILVEVINCCRSNSDLYPKIAAAANGDLEPTWRDVIRAFLTIGARLLERRFTDGTRYWRYETDVWTKGGLRELVDVLHFPTESQWTIKLGIYGSTHTVTLKNPTPAQVFTAACLVGLTGAS